SLTGLGGRRVTYSYDAMSGNIRRFQDAAGRITSLTFNGDGRLSRVVRPDGVMTTFNYGTGIAPPLTAIVEPGSQTTTFSYLAMPTLALNGVIDPKNRRTTYLN